MTMRWLTLLALVALGGYLRAAHLAEDLPYLPNVDEAWFIWPALRAAADGDWNPRWFGHPGSTMIYPLAILFRLFASPVNEAFKADAARFYMWGRWLAVLYGTLTLPLLFAAVRRFLNTATALAVVLLVTVQPALVDHCKIARTDAASMFFTALVLLALARLDDAPSLRRYVFAGVALGLAVATKYYLVVFAPMVALIAWRERAPRRLALAALTTVLTFLAVTPYFLPAFVSDVLPSVASEAEPVFLVPYERSWAGAVSWYLRALLVDELRWVLAVFFVVGLVALLRARRWLLVGLAGTVLVFIGGIATLHMLQMRWLLPFELVCFPIALHGVAVLAGALVRALGRPAWLGDALVVATAIVLAVPRWRYSNEVNQGLARHNTDYEARRWAFAHLPAGTRIVSDHFMSSWVGWPDGHTVYGGGSWLDVRSMGRRTFADEPLPRLRCDGVTHLIVNLNKLVRDLDASVYPTLLWYAALRQDGRLVAAFLPTEELPGRPLQIWDISAIECGK